MLVIETVAFATRVTPSTRNTVPVMVPEAESGRFKVSVCPGRDNAPVLKPRKFVAGSDATTRTGPRGISWNSYVPVLSVEAEELTLLAVRTAVAFDTICEFGRVTT